MKTICLFSSFFIQNKIPLYIKLYLEELRRHFDELVFITNQKELDFSEIIDLKNRDIRIEFVENEGYDFGMWYKILTKLDVGKYSRIGLVNDSCVLFRKLDRFFQWVNETNLDYCGLIDSNELSYHIQSYFIIINCPALISLQNYFLEHGVINDKVQVIHSYEIGLSKFMNQQGYKLGAFFSCFKYSGDKNINILLHKVPELVIDGLPIAKRQTVLNFLLLKKTIIFNWLPKIRQVNRILASENINFKDFFPKSKKPVNQKRIVLK